MRIIIAALVLACALAARAQDYPAHAVTIIVPFSAGGPTDTIARIVAQRLGKSLGQNVLVENVTGAGGTIGVGRVARAAPDGYTLSIGHIGTHVVNGAIYELPYDLLRDFEPVAMIAANPQIIVSNNAVPAKDLKELLAWMRANPEKVAVATGGAGTPAHVSAAYLQKTSGIQFQIIHYRGAAPAMQDLLAGHVQLTFDQAANSLPQVRAGRIRPYAVTAKTRLLAAPEIPTVDEAGLPNFYMSVWHGIWAPRGTPKAVIAKLNSGLVATLADADVRKRLADLGQEIPAREQQTPEALARHHKAEIEKWWPVIKGAGIRAE